MKTREAHPPSSAPFISGRAILNSFSTLLFAILLPTALFHSAAAETTKQIDIGREIYLQSANCAICHGWAGQGSPAMNAPNLRLITYDSKLLEMTVRCGRPGTAMPYHDPNAYLDGRCFGIIENKLNEIEKAEMIPNVGTTLSEEQLEALLLYIDVAIKGKGKITFEECIDQFGDSSTFCATYQK